LPWERLDDKPAGLASRYLGQSFEIEDYVITFDEVLDEAVERAFEEVSKRSPQLSEEEKRKIANFVGLGAVRYALVDVDASKPVVFTWDRVLNFETNSAPYVQYTHARACSILRKASKKPEIKSIKAATIKSKSLDCELQYT
jgi:arginyl-tRNA synthetase